MTPALWPCPLPEGTEAEELALTCDRQRQHRVLIVPALFDEANKLRRLAVEVMRRLDAAGIDSVLPDLPGTNESLRPLAEQTLAGWTGAMLGAVNHFRATHVLAIRGGGLILPKVIPGWLYGPVKGAAVLRQMLRARIIAGRELGREETREELLSLGSHSGLDLSGYHIGAELLQALNEADPATRAGITAIDQDTIGGSALWLRAEPDEDREQADALAAIIAIGVMA